ncbi:MAG TPA: iron-containing alcohol dehydrogenase [Firmicutes bacterium]|nr:iron-containing alcohol dehydrogenase [Bacillota bacterium]
MPTRVIHGERELVKQAGLLKQLGNRCLLVTGKTSARVSGALDDAVEALKSQGIEYELFDQVENNPSLENVGAGGKAARKFRPDFILGIGGGSPLDASKAVAVLAVNNIEPEELYRNKFDNPPLPIVAVPTTAGTGSEVTPYSVLTHNELETKKSFSVPELFPRIAFLDWRYTEKLPLSITRDTALDALSHLVEGYLSRKAIGTSDFLAERGMKLWAKCLKGLREGALTPEDRDLLLVASTLGGMVIAHTGTTLVHALGYPLTYYHGLPHGRANGLLLGEYLRFSAQYVPERVNDVLAWLGLKDIGEFSRIMGELAGPMVGLTGEEVKQYAAKAAATKNAAQSQGDVTETVLQRILECS